MHPVGVTPSTKGTTRFLTDDFRWQAVVDRDQTADGEFFYAVATTGVYCRPTCPSRLPLRKNVRFHATRQAAEAAGFRPCKRCRPGEAGQAEQHAAIVTQVCRVIERADSATSLPDLAAAVGLSPFHLHRIFRAQTGLTPKKYAAAHRTQRVRKALSEQRSVTAAIYSVGYNSPGRFYESATKQLGMTPSDYRNGGRGVMMRFAVGQCWLGGILVAASSQGICAILLGDDPDALTRDLQDRFPHAELVGGDDPFEQWMAQVVGFVGNPKAGLDLPLDIQGTAFQQLVWEAMQQVSAGSTVSYAELAARIGRPKSVRAVAGACAANPLAVAIPCHRVVRTDGSLSGYRWGIDRKRRLIQREQQ